MATLLSVDEAWIEGTEFCLWTKLALLELTACVRREGGDLKVYITEGVVKMTWVSDKFYVQATITDTTATFVYNALPESQFIQTTRS